MKALRNKKGLSYIETVIWILVLCMLLSIILTYATLMIHIQTAQNNTQRVLDSFVTDNSVAIYNSLKNGHDNTRSLDGEYFKATLSDEMALDFDGSTLYFRTADNGEMYRMTNLRVNYEVDRKYHLKLQATYNIVFPIVFAGQKLTNLTIAQKVVAYYNVK